MNVPRWEGIVTWGVRMEWHKGSLLEKRFSDIASGTSRKWWDCQGTEANA
jgi:hypothetical protein